MIGRLLEWRRTEARRKKGFEPRVVPVRVKSRSGGISRHKDKNNNRVVRVSTRVVFGTAAAVALAVAASAVGRVVNTSFVERHNGTDRNRCSRKVRKSYGFSKDWAVHRGATVFSYFSYNFCWPVRTLRVKGEGGRWQSGPRRWPQG